MEKNIGSVRLSSKTIDLVNSYSTNPYVRDLLLSFLNYSRLGMHHNSPSNKKACEDIKTFVLKSSKRKVFSTEELRRACNTTSSVATYALNQLVDENFLFRLHKGAYVLYDERAVKGRYSILAGNIHYTTRDNEQMLFPEEPTVIVDNKPDSFTEG